MIAALHLTNFKCFSDQIIECGPLTLLSGLNGMGKSTVLQALLVLRQSYQQGLLPEKALALNGNLVKVGTVQDALFEGALQEELIFEISWTRGIKGVWRFSYNRDQNIFALNSPAIPDAVLATSLFSDSFHYLEAERIGPRTSFEVSDFEVRQHRQIGTRGELTAHFLSVYGDSPIQVQGLKALNAVSSNLRDQVEAWMHTVSPGIRLHVAEHALRDGMDLVSLRYSFVQGQQVSNAYRSTNVGFGLTYSLPIFVAVLSSRPGSLILLENPEAHLHPKGQARLGEFLAIAASQGIQIIAETHSDHVLNGVRVAVHQGKLRASDTRIHFFQRRMTDAETAQEVLSPMLDDQGRLSFWPDGFFDEWDKALEMLI